MCWCVICAETLNRLSTPPTSLVTASVATPSGLDDAERNFSPSGPKAERPLSPGMSMTSTSAAFAGSVTSKTQTELVRSRPTNKHGTPSTSPKTTASGSGPLSSERLSRQRPFASIACSSTSPESKTTLPAVSQIVTERAPNE